MRKLSYLLLIGLFTISLSVLGQEAKNNNAFSVSIKDFGGAIYELENNYAGFTNDGFILDCLSDGRLLFRNPSTKVWQSITKNNV